MILVKAFAAICKRGRDGPPPAIGAGPGEAMCVATDRGFGTLSSSLIALETQMAPNARRIWLFSDGAPDSTPYLPVITART